jgi:hypothetical protein
MPDGVAKAARYRALADECKKLAGLCTCADLQEQFQKLAENYLILAGAELTRAEQEGGRLQGLTLLHHRKSPDSSGAKSREESSVCERYAYSRTAGDVGCKNVTSPEKEALNRPVAL